MTPLPLIRLKEVFFDPSFSMGEKKEREKNRSRFKLKEGRNLPLLVVAKSNNQWVQKKTRFGKTVFILCLGE